MRRLFTLLLLLSTIGTLFLSLKLIGIEPFIDGDNITMVGRIVYGLIILSTILTIVVYLRDKIYKTLADDLDTQNEENGDENEEGGDDGGDEEKNDGGDEEKDEGGDEEENGDDEENDTAKKDKKKK